MPTQQFNISLDTELMERFTRLAGKGNRTAIITQKIKEYCDEKDKSAILENARANHIKKELIPLILEYAGAREPYCIITSEQFRADMKERGYEFTKADIKEGVEEIYRERDRAR